MKNELDYYGWCDESRYNKSRFRSIAMVSHSGDIKEELINSLNCVLYKNNVKEIKLSRLCNNKKEKVIKEWIDILFNFLQKYKVMTKLRIDILIWDIQDSRHLITSRDDVNNLQRMYYHLFKNVLINRWKKGHWIIFPDENTAIKWNKVERFLKMLKEDFNIIKIEEKSSKDNVLIQLADIFAGLGSYSWNNCQKYSKWVEKSKNQKTLLPKTNQKFQKLSIKDRYTFQIIDFLLKKRNLLNNGKVLSFDHISNKGLITRDPNFPINFWLYVPQSSDDKAPTKKEKRKTFKNNLFNYFKGWRKCIKNLMKNIMLRMLSLHICRG